MLSLVAALSLGLAPSGATAGTAEEIDVLPILDAPKRVESPLSSEGKRSAVIGGTMFRRRGVEEDLGIAARRGMGAR